MPCASQAIIHGRNCLYQEWFRGVMSNRAQIEPAAPTQAPRSVGFLISQLGLASSKRFADELRPLGIHPGEFALMRFVSAAAGQSQHALAEQLAVPPSRMVAKV